MLALVRYNQFGPGRAHWPSERIPYDAAGGCFAPNPAVHPPHLAALDHLGFRYSVGTPSRQAWRPLDFGLFSMGSFITATDSLLN